MRCRGRSGLAFDGRPRPGQPAEVPERIAPATFGPRMLAGVLLTGLAAGAGGVALTLLLHGIQHLAFGYTENTFLIGVERASAARRVLALAIGGVVVGPGWWLLRRLGQPVISVAAAVADPSRRLPLLVTTCDSVLQVVAVGFGASLGREGAPRQLGAAAGGLLARLLGLSVRQRRTLLACGAGAGLAAVYNVPLGGAAFTLEMVLASAAVSDAVPALLTAAIATAVAWPVLSDLPTYQVGSFGLTAPLFTWALLAGPVAGVVGAGFGRLMRAAKASAPRGRRLMVAVPLAFTAVGLLAIGFPQLPGNGKGPAQLAFDGSLSLPLLAALVLLKPLATSLCLRSGARGGLLTPSLATGALLGALTGTLWGELWPGAPVGAYAVIGAAAVLATTQRAPLTAIVLTLEFTRTGLGLLAPMALCVGLAVVTGGYLDRRRPRPQAAVN